MAKYREIVYDNLKNLKQVFASSDIQEYQVLWWVSMVANKFLKGHLDNQWAKSGQMSGKFLSVFPEVKVLTSPVNTGNIIKKRKYVELPGILMDFDFERGVDYVSYDLSSIEPSAPPFTQVLFDRTTSGGAHRLYASHELPSPQRPYFYLVNKYMYFLGIEDANIENLEMGLYLNIDPREIVDMDDECPLPGHLLSQMNYEIVNLGRFVMSVPMDKINDGNDTTVTQPPKQIVNEQQ
jgi:hypothetical protein